MTSRLCPLATCALLLFTSPVLAMTWQDANKASVAMMNEGKLKEAFDLAWQSTELYEQSPTYKPTSHERLLLNAADIFLQMNDKRETPAMLKRAITALKRHVSEDDPTLIALTEQLAMAYARLGEFEDAQDMRERVVSLYAKNHGADSVGHLTALLDLARSVKQLRDPVDTRRYLDRASTAVASLPVDHALRLLVDYEQALLTLEANRKSDAEAMFRSIADRGKSSSSDIVRDMLRPTYGKLAYIAFERGEHDQVDQWVEATRGLPVPAGEPQPLFREAPRMPGGSDLALAGHAVIEYSISTANGKVVESTILEKSGNPQWATICANQVKEWRYQPTVPVGDPGTLVKVKERFAYQYENEEPELGSRLKRRN